MRTFSANDFQSLFPPRQEDAHKGNFGHVLIVAGCEQYSGAARLAISGALRSGAGLVSCCVPGRIWNVVAAWETCAMTIPLGQESHFIPSHFQIIEPLLDRCQALVVGPGLGRAPETTQLLIQLLSSFEFPVVLDADALWHFAQAPMQARNNWVLTPHEGEFLRLGGNLNISREKGATDLARSLGCTIHLKGHISVTASPDGSLSLNTTGNPGMAKGGSGDILAGLTGGFLARGLTPENAVSAAAWLLGKSGDMCGAELSFEAMLPTDTLKFLPLAWKKGLE